MCVFPPSLFFPRISCLSLKPDHVTRLEAVIEIRVERKQADLVVLKSRHPRREIEAVERLAGVIAADGPEHVGVELDEFAALGLAPDDALDEDVVRIETVELGRDRDG